MSSDTEEDWSDEDQDRPTVDEDVLREVIIRRLMEILIRSACQLMVLNQIAGVRKFSSFSEFKTWLLSKMVHQVDITLDTLVEASQGCIRIGPALKDDVWLAMAQSFDSWGLEKFWDSELNCFVLGAGWVGEGAPLERIRPMDAEPDPAGEVQVETSRCPIIVVPSKTVGLGDRVSSLKAPEVAVETDRVTMATYGNECDVRCCRPTWFGQIVGWFLVMLMTLSMVCRWGGNQRSSRGIKAQWELVCSFEADERNVGRWFMVRAAWYAAYCADVVERAHSVAKPWNWRKSISWFKGHLQIATWVFKM